MNIIPLEQRQISEVIEHAYNTHGAILESGHESLALDFCECSGLMAYTLGIDDALVFVDKYIKYHGHELSMKTGPVIIIKNNRGEIIASFLGPYRDYNARYFYTKLCWDEVMYCGGDLIPQ